MPILEEKPREEQKVIISAWTPITQFLPEWWVEVREFTPEVVKALEDIRIRGIDVVATVVSKAMWKSQAFVKGFSVFKESPERDRVPGFVLQNDIEVEVLDWKLKMTEILATPLNGELWRIDL